MTPHLASKHTPQAKGPDSPTTGPPTHGAGPRLLQSSDVLGGHSAVVIAHNGQHYRLQATRQGKLILTK